jgi:hypothetical protein
MGALSCQPRADRGKTYLSSTTIEMLVIEMLNKHFD